MGHFSRLVEWCLTHSSRGIKAVLTLCLTDVAGSVGCGAVWGSRWLQCQWQGALWEKAIAIQELLPVLLACMIWRPLWVGSLVVIHCDNQTVVSVVNSGYSKDKDLIDFMRCLFFVWVYWGFELHQEHIPGEENVTADTISCGNIHLFFQVSSDTLSQVIPVPPAVLKLLVTQQPDWSSPRWATLFKRYLQQVWPLQQATQ